MVDRSILEWSQHYYIGNMDNFSLPEKQGFALYMTAKELWDMCDPVVGGERHQVDYYEQINSVILAQETPYTVWQDLRDADVTVTPSGATEEVPALEHIDYTNTPVYYQCVTEVASSQTININSKQAIMPDPIIYISVIRVPQPPQVPTPQITPRLWRFDFGANWRLEWSTTQFPTFTCPGGEVYTYRMIDTDFRDYVAEEKYTIMISCDGDMIHIDSKLFPSRWSIRNPTGQAWNVPSAAWNFESVNGGMYAVNVSVPSYFTDGYLITKWIDVYQEYPDEDLVWQHYPPFAQGGAGEPTVAFTIHESRPLSSGDYAGVITQHRFKLALTHDGVSTPRVKALQFHYRPTFTVANDVWTEITPYVKQYNDTLTYDMSPNQCQLTLDLQRTVYNDATGNYETLYQFLGGNLSGLYSFKSELGFVQADGTVSTHQRMVGVIEARTGTSSITDKTIQFTAYDRWALVAMTTAFFAPCGVDYEPSTIIGLWLEWAGIAPSDIVLEPPTYLSPTLWYERTDYASPQWMPDFGGKLDELIRRYCKRMGMRVDFDADGTVSVHPARRTGEVVTHLTTDRTEAYADYGVYAPEHALINVTLNGSMTNAVNSVVVRGKDKDGDPLFYTLYDPTTFDPSTETYMGLWSTVVISDDDLTTQDAVTAACWEAYLDRETGVPEISVTSPYALWDAVPGEFVSLTDYHLDIVARVGRVMSVGISWGVDQGVVLNVQGTLKLEPASFVAEV